MYSIENLNTKKEQEMHGLLMEWASDMAEKLTAGDCTREQMWIETEDGDTLTEEAQDIFNEYYDEMTEEAYKMANLIIKTHNA